MNNRGKDLGDLFREMIEQRVSETTEKNGYTIDELRAVSKTILKIKDKNHLANLLAAMISSWHMVNDDEENIFRFMARLTHHVYGVEGNDQC